jgi:hypothetical protein
MMKGKTMLNKLLNMLWGEDKISGVDFGIDLVIRHGNLKPGDEWIAALGNSLWVGLRPVLPIDLIGLSHVNDIEGTPDGL